jgi:hypothetical protein
VTRIIALVLLCSSIAGCELVANFDRGKIPQPDAGKSHAPPAITTPVADAAVASDASPQDASGDDAGGR